MGKLPLRILSIDVLRAITMFLMIFVNDVAGVSHIPAWIEHAEADVDAMGFSDLIFPAFLFIVGLSLPLAIQSRIRKGKSWGSIAAYILLRALALLVMGFFHVNLENYNGETALLSYSVFTLLLTLAFFLIWLDYSDNLSKIKKYTCIGTGIVLLLALAYLYKGGSNDHPEGLKPHWWGILGIIGWAYLVSAFVYLFSKGKISVLVVAFIAFAAINLLSHMDLMPFHLPVIGDASSITLMVGGALVSTVYALLVEQSKDQALWLFLGAFGLLSIAFGSLVRPFAGGISKIYATPAWVFICMGITVLVFELLIYVVDVKGKKDWFKWIRPAGTSTLTCYLIPYLLYSILGILHLHYPHVLREGAFGMLRCLAVTILVIGIVALLERKRLRLKV